MAKSLVDYVFRWLGSKFLGADEKQAIGVISRDTDSVAPVPVTEQEVVSRSASGSNGEGTKFTFETSTDAPACHECGSIMVRNAACYKCLNCGATSGCS
jgi:ribonucleoside-diphosphate reductase alpha chain